ncbi:MAG: hypothetical protein QOI31_957 [Solirubrobacterales bacterium]|jgi:hypothetical protein|nr:hypothetical protein [Solirubrobacterales bacterium]
MALHPAENRGYRELMLTAEEARTRLRRIAGHLDIETRAVCDKGSETLGEMILEFTPALAEHDLHSELAARGTGSRIGTVRAEILDRFLERNQALRFAVDDVEHVTTLLAYMGSVSSSRGKKNLPELCGTWERKLRRQVTALRKAAVELGSHPDDAIEPLDPGALGKAAHGSAVAVGHVGEAVDKGVNKAKETTSAVKEKSGFFDQAQNGETATEGEDKKRRGLFRRG